MRKLISIILLLSLLLSCLSGCFSSIDGETRPISGNSDKTEPSGSNDAGTESQPTEPTGVTIVETVLYDKDNIKVTLTEMNEGWLGTEFKLLVENNTSRNIALSADLLVVNGITVSTLTYIDVAAGKKSNGEIVLYTSELQQAGINTISTVRAYDAHIVDTDTYETVCDVSMEFETSAVGYQQEIDNSGDVVFNEAGVTVTAKHISNDLLGQAVCLLVNNETGKDIIVSAENVSVNGYTMTAWLYDTVCEGTVRYCILQLFSTELEDNNIEKVEEITFNIEVIEANSYDRIAESDEIVITVND